MINDIEKIVNEWFFRLPNGYPKTPNSKEDLLVLEQILKEFGVRNWKSIIQYMQEADKSELNTDTDVGETPPLEPETHESNEDFRNLLDSFEKFSDIINKRYISPGLQIKGLENLYTEIVALPDSLKDNIRRIIGKRTNRDLFNGTFEMGQYEKLLLELIEKTILISNIKNEVFWFAIILDGMVKPNPADSTSLEGNVEVDGSNVEIGKFGNEAVSLGTLSPELISMLTVIVNLGEVIDGSKIEEFSKESINELLKKISDDANKQELEQFLNLSNSSQLSALKALSNSIKTSLENHDINELPTKFCTEMDRFISEVLARVPYWATITDNMVYITTGQTLYPSLNCTKEYRLGGGIYKIQNNNLIILGDIIKEKLV